MLQQLDSLLTRAQANAGTVTAEVHSHYEGARLKAYVNKVISLVTLRDNSLQASADVLTGYCATGQHDEGLRTVPIADIVGSINRAEDFDRSFMPVHGRTRQRWMSVDRAYLKGVPLPPVELFQIGDAYFVVDGHHRLSVAKSHGQLYIEARVIRRNIAEC